MSNDDFEQGGGNIIQIAPAKLEGMRFLISLFGLSETGKTRSALELASGIEPDPAKRGLLDTEGGQRGRAYVNDIPGGYLYAQLRPPYTPERYIAAVRQFEAAGVTTLVTDSISHAWFAEGGVLDMVDNSTTKNDMAKWKAPKRRLEKLMQCYRHSDMHHIFCSRAKQPLVEIEENGKKKYVAGPVVPIQEKMMRFDMTIIAHMLGDGRFDISRPAGKCPVLLRPIFAEGELINRAMGEKLIQWLGRQPGKSAEERALENAATDAAGEGVEAFRKFWGGLTKDQRAVINPGRSNYQSIAQAADEAKHRATEDQDDQPGDQPGPETTITHVGKTSAEPVAIPIGLKDGAPDWDTFVDQAKAAIAGAPSQPWLDQFVALHKAALTNLSIAEPTAHKAVAEAIKAKSGAFNSRAA
jgi:hypothetical protein